MPLHIVQRGNNRGICFHQERDYRVYLSLLAEMASKHACDVHAYVLMTNHVHLLLTPKDPESASGLMKNLGQRYVQFVNRNHGRTGSLWEGRFRSSIVDSEIYLLRCYRYIEMNPVRAGMVDRPSGYSWSSYGTNAQGLPSKVVTPHVQYLALGETDALRREAYAQLFEAGLTSDELMEIRKAACGGFALGRPDFVSAVEIAAGKPARRRSAGRPRKTEASPDHPTIIGI